MVVILIVLRFVDPKALFFIDICPSEGDSNWENGNIHHDHVRDLDCRMQLGDGYHRKTSGAGTGSLEKAIHDFDTSG